MHQFLEWKGPSDPGVDANRDCITGAQVKASCSTNTATATAASSTRDEPLTPCA